MAACFGSHMAEEAQARRDADADQGDAREAAFHALQGEVIKALEAGNVAVLISTPGWGEHRQRGTLDDVLCNAIADAQTWRDLIATVVLAAKSSDPAVRAPAMAWMVRVSADHAEFHVDDALRLAETDVDLPAPRRMWRAK